MDRTSLPIVPGHRRKTAVLLAGCSLTAVLALSSQQVAAQSFNGTPSVVAGAADVTTGPGTTNITVKSPETVIDWFSFADVDPNAINFQPVGTTATFVDGSVSGAPLNYTVLNRIMPLNGNSEPTAATVAFNGTVNSLVGGKQGGNVWFYSPTGIIVGPTAKFNVGGLILTTNDITTGAANTGGTELYGPNNTVLFRGPADSKGFVDVQDKSTINATSYVALVAPRVQQGGMISADGPIAYVGAEQADISINAGLFDISIGVGTTDANGVVHTGTTTGPASSSGSDQQQIMVVAMPKATALTMLLSGSIGYTPAVDAFNDGSSIILSAGYDKPTPTAESPDSLGHISIDNATFLNPLFAYSTGSIDMSAVNGPVTFNSNTTLYASDSIGITLDGNGSLAANGLFYLNAGRLGKGGTIDIALGGKASLTAPVFLNLNATSSYATPFFGGSYVDATGGKITVDVAGGSLITPYINADVSAYGQFDGVLGGKGTAGSISFTARNGGLISTPELTAYADAQGGGSDDTAGDAFGGSISLTSTNGALDLDSVYFEANAYAGYGTNVGGAATGGKASIVLDGGLYDWNDISAFNDATAGNSDTQGNVATGRADAVTLSLVNGAALTVANDIILSSDAYGSFNALAGSSVHGGGINVSVTGGSSLAFGNLTASAGGFIEEPFSFFGPAPDRTPDTLGGTIDLSADGGSISGVRISLAADADNFGAALSAGTATGGIVRATVMNGGSLTLFSGEGGGDLNLSATGHGAIGQSAANAVGGQAALTVSDGTVTMDGAINLSAGAGANNVAMFYDSGVNPVGFSATGGTATINLLAGTLGTGSVTARDLIVDASGDAATREFFYPGCCETIEPGIYGGPMSADGGVGTGGTAALNISGGTLNLSTATVSANGSGALSAESGSGTPFRSGDGHGGSAAMTVSGGTATITNLSVTALGIGGDGSPTGSPGTQPSLAGDGYGGNASLAFSGGTVQADTLTIDADGTGGVGGDGPDDESPTPGTDGGKGTGGTASLISPGGSTGQLTAPTISITAIGTGGVGGQAALGSQGNGGNGIGGTAVADLADGAFVLGPLKLDAEGFGGDGAVGGEGSGGIAKFLLNDTAAGPSGNRTIDGLQLSASGAGGFGTGGTAQSDAGSAQLALNATGPLTIDGDLGVSVEGSRSAAGDGFTGSFSGTPVHVTGNTAIFTTRDATLTATTPLQTEGDLDVTARKLSGTGQFAAGGHVAISADQGIALDKVSAGTTTTLQAANGAILVTTDLESGGDVSAVGRSIDITSLGALNFATAQATAGNLRVSTVGNLTMGTPLVTGAVDLSSSGGAVTVTGALNSGGNASVSGNTGVSLATLTAGGTGTLTSANGIVSASGNVSSTGAFSASGRNGVSFGNLTSGGTTALDSSNGAITVSNLSSVGLVTANGGSIDIGSAEGLNFDTVTSPGTVSITAAGNLAFNGVNVGSDLTLTSTSGSLSTTGAITGGLTQLSSLNGITIGGGLTALGDLVVSTQGAFTVNGSSTSDDTYVGADGGITMGSVRTGEITNLTATNGNILIDNLDTSGRVSAEGLAVDISSGGSLIVDVARATQDDVVIRTGGDLMAQTLFANRDLTLTANGTFALSGSAQGTNITVTSADIALGGEASVGARDFTSEITLINGSPSRETFIGGATQTGGYSLDKDEAARLFADRGITVGVSSDAASDEGHVTVGDLALGYETGARNIGSGGFFEITTPGDVSIVGNVALTTGNEVDRFIIDPARVELNTDTGSVAMLDANGNPLGRLQITGDTVAVGTGSTLNQLRGLTDMAAINALLDAPGGKTDPLRAGGLIFTVVDGLFIQNSGSTTDFNARRGFRANTFDIFSQATTKIVVNGVIIQNGTAVTGADVVPLVTVNERAAAAGGSFDALSTINGCVIGGTCVLPPPPPPPEPEVPITPTPNDDLTPPVSPVNPGEGTFVGSLVGLEANEPLITPPLVDEPITGVGNDDLWLQQCTDPNQEGCPQRDSDK